MKATQARKLLEEMRDGACGNADASTAAYPTKKGRSRDGGQSRIDCYISAQNIKLGTNGRRLQVGTSAAIAEGLVRRCFVIHQGPTPSDEIELIFSEWSAHIDNGRRGYREKVIGLANRADDRDRFVDLMPDSIRLLRGTR
jgi:hypothetical protein